MTNSMIMFLEASAAKILVSDLQIVAGPTGTGCKITPKSNERRYICDQIDQ